MSQGSLIIGAIMAAFLLFITARTDANGTPELVTYIRLLI